jgi:histone-binding protein RBBP4
LEGRAPDAATPCPRSTPPPLHPNPQTTNNNTNSWGPVIPQQAPASATGPQAAANANATTTTTTAGTAAPPPSLRTTHRLYLSEQTEQAKLDPPKLIAVDVEVAKPCVASAQSLAAWNEYGRASGMRVVKTIVHPGEVNKIRDLPSHPHVVVTHTDSPELYVWNMETQPDVRPKAGVVGGAGGPGGSASGGPTGGGLTASGAGVQWPTTPNTADAVLRGHKQDAQFPLATSAAGASGGGPSLVASGGQDRLVLLWSLADVQSAALASAAAAKGASGGVSPATRGGGSANGGSGSGGARATAIDARVKLEGHADTVEDVVFRPGSSEVLASVGDDKQLLFWDTRCAGRGGKGGGGGGGGGPVCAVKGAHGPEADVHCVDWSGLREHVVATGAADGSVRVWDVRALSSALSVGGGGGAGAKGAAAAPACVRTWRGAHTAAVMRVEWHPHAPGVFATGGEDHTVLLWRLGLQEGGAGGVVPESEVEGGEEEGAVGSGGGGGRGRGAGAAAGPGTGSSSAAPKELLFRHVGHRQGRVIDLQWCPADDWLLCSVSDDTSADYSAAQAAQAAADAAAKAAAAATTTQAAAADSSATNPPAPAGAAPPANAVAAAVGRGGGTLQVWRVNDLLYRADDEVVRELERQREWMVSGGQRPAAAQAQAQAAQGAGQAE